jgi:hypothetical protein
VSLEYRIENLYYPYRSRKRAEALGLRLVAYVRAGGWITHWPTITWDPIGKGYEVSVSAWRS